MNGKHYRYLFGPVPSRRLGRSLGVDLLCERRCSFDCVFCEVGATDVLTRERREYVPTAAVIAELHDWLREGGQADVITLAGAGEPTLHTGFGEVIDAVHAACRIPVALLTNSTLLGDADVRAAAARADIVKVSLSAWDDASMVALNHPAEGLTFAGLLDGLRVFCATYRGRLWVEVLLVRGINDAPEQVARIAALTAGLKPEKVQLNTVVRPPAFETAEAVGEESLAALALLFTPPAEVIAPHRGGGAAKRELAEAGDDLRAMLARRPCTAGDIAAVMGITPEAAMARAEALVAAGTVHHVEKDGVRYYSA
jgi:wyosine [tRNA(Phe)-imidazoG37] synthetase (radical SAM superfamily)